MCSRVFGRLKGKILFQRGNMIIFLLKNIICFYAQWKHLLINNGRSEFQIEFIPIVKSFCSYFDRYFQLNNSTN